MLKFLEEAGSGVSETESYVGDSLVTLKNFDPFLKKLLVPTLYRLLVFKNLTKVSWLFLSNLAEFCLYSKLFSR